MRCPTNGLLLPLLRRRRCDYRKIILYRR
jgi:hypothetical protein